MALHRGYSKGCAATFTHDQTIGRLSRQKWLQQHHCYVLNMSINDLRPCIVDNQGAVPRHYSIIELQAAFLGTMLSTTS